MTAFQRFAGRKSKALIFAGNWPVAGPELCFAFCQESTPKDGYGSDSLGWPLSDSLDICFSVRFILSGCAGT
jgi:hypothetical protein